MNPYCAVHWVGCLHCKAAFGHSTFWSKVAAGCDGSLTNMISQFNFVVFTFTTGLGSFTVNGCVLLFHFLVCFSDKNQN